MKKIIVLVLSGILFSGVNSCWAVKKKQTPEQVKIVYLTLLEKPRPKLSNLDLPIENEGIQGGEIGIRDTNGTGRFMNQEFSLQTIKIPYNGNVIGTFRKLQKEGIQLFILNIPSGKLLELADLPEAKESLLFNVGATADRLRYQDCRTNILHILPSAAMQADALAQFLISKRWKKWFLVIGRREEDRLYAAAMRRAAKRFGGKIVAEKIWEYGPDARRTAQSEVPVFTQSVDYDVLLVADVIGEFGEYLMYRTWEPKVIAGTQGLVPTSWHRTHEQWGAVQMQSRFLKTYGRMMTPLDYSVWSAVRAIGEGATRTRSVKFRNIRNYIQGEKFVLAAYKGQKLTFRKWNGQLRQPILLTAARALVSVSPQRQFLHQFSQMDTLGYDRPEVKCEMQ